MKKNDRGFLLHAFGYKDLDYARLAVCCALSIKTHLKENHITLLTDDGTRRWMKKTIPSPVINKSFDNIIISKDKFKHGKRRHFDSPWFSFKAEFKNQSRTLAYHYTPYDETIMVDVDYLVMNDMFDSVWGNNEDVLMNYKAVDLQGNQFGNIDDQRLSPYGVPMYWATLMYFKKSPFAESFFDIVEYVRDEYNFFQFLYGFKKSFFRNDFSVSIAAHILSGNVACGIKSFPEDKIISSYQQDTIADVIDTDELIMISNDRKEEWKDVLVNTSGMSVHVMNKRAIERISEKYIKMCMEKL